MENQLARADLAVGHDFEVLDTSPDTATLWRRYKMENHLRVVFICLFEKSTSSNEFALLPQNSYMIGKEWILSEIHESRGEIINEKNDVITG